VPFTAAGNLSIVASADLGALGARAGAAVPYHWEMPNLAPYLLPWLVILGLLTLKPNRNPATWLVWLPVMVAYLISQLPLGLPSQGGYLLDAAGALAFGLAAAWLLSPYLRRAHRVTTAVCTFLTLVAFGLFFIATKQFSNLSSLEWIFQLMVLGMGGLASTVGLGLGGWLCRRQFQAIRLYLGVLVCLLVVWFGITLPFFLTAVASSGSELPWSEFLVPILGVAGVNFALLLPFLILSSASSFYRERLKWLLHVSPPAPPTLPIPVPVEPVAALE